MESRRARTLKYISLNGQNSAVRDRAVRREGRPARPSRLQRLQERLQAVLGPRPGQYRRGARGAEEGRPHRRQGLHHPGAADRRARWARCSPATSTAATRWNQRPPMMVAQKIGKRVSRRASSPRICWAARTASAFAAGAVLSDKFIERPARRGQALRRRVGAWCEGRAERQQHARLPHRRHEGAARAGRVRAAAAHRAWRPT